MNVRLCLCFPQWLYAIFVKGGLILLSLLKSVVTIHTGLFTHCPHSLTKAIHYHFLLTTFTFLFFFIFTAAESPNSKSSSNSFINLSSTLYGPDPKGFPSCAAFRSCDITKTSDEDCKLFCKNVVVEYGSEDLYTPSSKEAYAKDSTVCDPSFRGVELSNCLTKKFGPSTLFGCSFNIPCVGEISRKTISKPSGNANSIIGISGKNILPTPKTTQDQFPSVAEKTFPFAGSWNTNYRAPLSGSISNTYRDKRNVNESFDFPFNKPESPAKHGERAFDPLIYRPHAPTHYAQKMTISKPTPQSAVAGFIYDKSGEPSKGTLPEETPPIPPKRNVKSTPLFPIQKVKLTRLDSFPGYRDINKKGTDYKPLNDMKSNPKQQTNILPVIQHPNDNTLWNTANDPVPELKISEKKPPVHVGASATIETDKSKEDLGKNVETIRLTQPVKIITKESPIVTPARDVKKKPKVASPELGADLKEKPKVASLEPATDLEKKLKVASLEPATDLEEKLKVVSLKPGMNLKEKLKAVSPKLTMNIKETPKFAPSEIATDVGKKPKVASPELGTSLEKKPKVASPEPATDSEKKLKAASLEPATDLEEKLKVASLEPTTDLEEKLKVASLKPAIDLKEKLKAVSPKPTMNIKGTPKFAPSELATHVGKKPKVASPELGTSVEKKPKVASPEPATDLEEKPKAVSLEPTTDLEEKLKVASLKPAIDLKEKLKAVSPKPTVNIKETPKFAPSELATGLEKKPKVASPEPATDSEKKLKAASLETATDLEEKLKVASLEPTTDLEEKLKVASLKPAIDLKEKLKAVSPKPTMNMKEKPKFAASELATDVEKKPKVASPELGTGLEKKPKVASLESATNLEEKPKAVSLEPATDLEEKLKVASLEPTTDLEEKLKVASLKPAIDLKEKLKAVSPKPTMNMKEKPKFAASELATDVEKKPKVASPEPATDLEEKPKAVSLEPTTDLEEKLKVASLKPAIDLKEKLKAVSPKPTVNIKETPKFAPSELATGLEKKPKVASLEPATDLEEKPKRASLELATDLEEKPKFVSPELVTNVEEKPKRASLELATDLQEKPKFVSPELVTNVEEKSKVASLKPTSDNLLPTNNLSVPFSESDDQKKAAIEEFSNINRNPTLPVTSTDKGLGNLLNLDEGNITNAPVVTTEELKTPNIISEPGNKLPNNAKINTGIEATTINPSQKIISDLPIKESEQSVKRKSRWKHPLGYSAAGLAGGIAGSLLAGSIMGGINKKATVEPLETGNIIYSPGLGASLQNTGIRQNTENTQPAEGIQEISKQERFFIAGALMFFASAVIIAIFFTPSQVPQRLKTLEQYEEWLDDDEEENREYSLHHDPTESSLVSPDSRPGPHKGPPRDDTHASIATTEHGGWSINPEISVAHRGLPTISYTKAAIDDDFHFSEGEVRETLVKIQDNQNGQ